MNVATVVVALCIAGSALILWILGERAIRRFERPWRISCVEDAADELLAADAAGDTAALFWVEALLAECAANAWQDLQP